MEDAAITPFIFTTQRRLWLADAPRAASDEQFSAALAGWDALERAFRCSGYADCIWGPRGSCPDDAPVLCDGCVGCKLSQEPKS